MLPKDYKKPAQKGNYFKPSTGANKVRIMSEAMVGFVDWDKTGEKPVPVRTPEEEPKLGIDYPKHFWAFVIWDYASSQIKIWEVTQSTIQGALFDLDSNEAWGDPKGYDLAITKEGEKLETKYSVMPNPASPVSAEATAALAANPVDMTKLWTNEDPFGGESPVNNTAMPTPQDDNIKPENIPF